MSSGRAVRPIGFSLLFLATASLWSVGAFAAPLLPGAALESPIGRFLLGETPQGLELMTKVLGRQVTSEDVQAFLEQFRGSNPTEATQLEGRVAQIRADLYRAQTQRAGGVETAESDSFSGAERSILREVAARELRVDATWHSADPQAGNIDFTPNQTPALDARTEFLSPVEEKTINLEEKPGEKAPEEIQKRERTGLREWYEDSQSCMQNRPSAASSSAEWKYLAQQWMISGAVTTGSYLITTGISKFDVGAFGVDLLMSLVSQGVGNRWMSSKDPLQVRWLKIFVWGHLRADLDAEVYRISPWTDTHGQAMDTAVSERLDFNYSWNAKTSWMSPLMYTVLNGIECLLDEGTGPQALARAARFKKGAFAIRTGVAVGNSILYYKLRNGATKH